MDSGKENLHGMRKPAWEVDVMGKLSPELKVARITAIVLACCWLSYSVWLVVKGWGAALPQDFHITDYKIQQAIAWSVWTIATPIWFLFEYYLFNKFEQKNPYNSPKAVEEFKHNQELAGKCWLAVAAVFLALYFGRRP